MKKLQNKGVFCDGFDIFNNQMNVEQNESEVWPLQI